MSSVISALAPARRASDAGLGRRRGGGVLLGAVPLLEGHQAGARGHHEQDHGDREDHAQAADQAGLRPRAHLLGAPFGLLVALGGVEEGDLGGGEPGVRALAPLQRLGQPHAAVELAVRAAEGVPPVGGRGEVLPDALAFHVLVQPGAQPRPGAGERLVGDLHDALRHW